MRLNLGCGHRKLDGWLNVDQQPGCAPDLVVDLETLPWPWADDSVDEILLSHVLEHLGATTDRYLAIWRELWRVCRHDARVTIRVPHPRHDSFLDDPTHVRPITRGGLLMLSQEENRRAIAEGAANSTLGLWLGIDFRMEGTNLLLEEPWRSQFKDGQISAAELRAAAARYSNVVSETTFILRAVKPATA